MTIYSVHRDAIRILFILIQGSVPLPQPDPFGAHSVFRGETRLNAFDFWMRYPDYLAEELLDFFEKSANRRHLEAAEQILSSDEPDIRRFPMIRYRFGAYEKIDDAMSLLRSRNLVRITGSKSGKKVLETDFLIMAAALELRDKIVRDFPPLRWYADRAILVAEVAGDSGGAALKERQYRRQEYAETEMGGIIPTISGRVRKRLEALRSTV